MNLQLTLLELKKTKIPFLVTRFIDTASVDDLDVLVSKKNYSAMIRKLEKLGYAQSSHDHAFGGRKKNYQRNLIKKGRIKVDLHKDFTWRKSKYLNSRLLWKTKKLKEIGSLKVYVPEESIDKFLILINVIFEKTYFLRTDYDHIHVLTKILFADDRFYAQAKKYGWDKTWRKFITWYTTTELDKNNFPVFLPIWIVLYSYVEKFAFERKIDLTSLAYYLFFYTRYKVNKKLPYS